MHVEVNGRRMWFDVDGAALVPDGPRMRTRPTVLLLHGGPGSYDHTYLKPDFARLTDVAQIVYLDLRDHGRSERGDPAAWSFEACADDVPAFCDAVGIVEPIVLGHSMGGLVAMLHGARHAGHARALALLSTFGRFDLARLVDGFRRAGGDDVARIAERSYSGDATVTTEEWSRVFRFFGPWVPGAEEQARKIVNAPLNPLGTDLLCRCDILAELRRIACPTLVCVGDEDPVTPAAASREIVASMRPGLARLEVLAGAGHFPWKDAPERFWSLVNAFVAAAG